MDAFISVSAALLLFSIIFGIVAVLNYKEREKELCNPDRQADASYAVFNLSGPSSYLRMAWYAAMFSAVSAITIAVYLIHSS